MKLPQLTLRDLFWLVALVACVCGCWSYGGHPVAVVFALACAFTIRFWQVDQLRAKRQRVRHAAKQRRLESLRRLHRKPCPMPANPYESPHAVSERSEILTPFLRAVGGFVLGTVGYTVLFGTALATLVFLLFWALTP